EMFLPEKLQEAVGSLEVVGPTGSRGPLVRSERVLYEAVDLAPDREVPPSWIPTFLAIGVLIAAALAGLAVSARRSAAGRLGFSVLGTLWALLMGLGGVLLAALWALTNHTAAHGNENLLQFNPAALPLIVLIPAFVYGARWARGPA